MTSKQCTKCYMVKPLSSYHLHHTSKDGYSTICKACKSKQDKERKQFKDIEKDLR